MTSISEMGRLARLHADRLRHDHVGSEHYLLAVLAEAELAVSQLLVAAGISVAKVDDVLSSDYVASEASTDSYSFDIAPLITNPTALQDVLEAKRTRPLTEEMAEVLAQARASSSLSPYGLFAIVFRRMDMNATSIIRRLGLDPNILADSLQQV